ncbi:anaerobic ribonucleoside-triphosphate reductase activating protein [Oxalobacter sp. OttesenSCG-928-P03]|nr:anaerobic ribonucleoside-triphosphate reductase activating protein [Oxalobacter sp. OttesenSCG-928-P03]
MYYSDLIFADTVNGPGFRVSLFVSGCTLNCAGCFNKQAQNFRFGKPYTQETEEAILKALSGEYISGLSILGGDPLEKKNAPEVISLCQKVKALYPHQTIWMWSGRTLEEIQENPLLSPVLDVIDTLVDGRFVEELKDETLQYRGSANQRVLSLH